MNSYVLTIVLLFWALGAQALIAGAAIEVCLRRKLPRDRYRIWLSLAVGSLLFCLYQGYLLELALKVGLYDPRQAMLAALAGSLTAMAVYGFRAREA